MKDFVNEKLIEIEKRENIKILYCAESGSRAWGFASPDSDYDVRFVYIRPREYYLKLDETRDVIEWQLDETWDINGWDIQKVLRLLHKSNPTIFEWGASPIVYKTTEDWGKVEEILNCYFSKKSGIYHYLNTAKRNQQFLKGEMVKWKKYFYVLRPLLACKWILAEGTPPPILFESLMEKYLPEDIKPEVLKLLDLKKKASEILEGKHIEPIDEYIERTMVEIEDSMTSITDCSNKSWGDLNALFMELIN